MNTIRQGDVQFIRIDAVPGNVKPRAGRVLFRGEATGHAHVVDVGELFESVDGLLYLKVDKLAHVTHEEHKTIDLLPGKYLVSQKRQFDMESDWRHVSD